MVRWASATRLLHRRSRMKRILEEFLEDSSSGGRSCRGRSPSSSPLENVMTFASLLSRRQVLVAIPLLGLFAQSTRLEGALAYGRHYYGGWSYYPQRTYYYSSYYYKPTPSYSGYKYHYCIYYPSQPQYVYYYNPYRKVYWGRYDLKAKGYSHLAEKDQKGELKDIPDSAFPKPGEMPAIPESDGAEKMLAVDPATLPTEKAPDDVPVK
jgi:hypothetical protein